jgi:cytochrome c-type biogenesis protein CcmH/NrfF
MQFSHTRARRLRLLPVIALGALLLIAAGDDSARVSRLGHQMMCMCGCNQILLECNHVGCAYSSRMRGELEAAVNRSASDGDVLQWFIENYGTTVLAAPTKTGFNRVAWIMPYVALTGGLLLVGLIVRAWRRRPLVVHASVPSPVRGEELSRFREQARRETEV